jgi:hypothetical protein
MPNLDGGHYFLTVLAPIRVDTMIDPIVGRSRSHQQMLAQKLALMATGRQTALSPADAWPSPFAANTQNHLARFTIISGLAYNGRVSGDALLDLARGISPLTPQPVDRLRTPYLLFAADIDAPDGEAAVRRYTDTLWATMQARQAERGEEGDLSIIFGNCAGFDGVDSPEKFYNYIRSCQLETTLPFNDYWPDGLKAADAALPTAALKLAALAAGAALVLWLLALLLNAIFAVAGADGSFIRFVAKVAAFGTIVVPALIGILWLTVYALYRWVLNRGMAPFPTAPGSDLPSVLKSLYLQQHFTRFAIEAQGLDDAALHARFGAFVAAVKPADAVPTQPPGEIRAPAVEW